jgi:hypothetical protein
LATAAQRISKNTVLPLEYAPSRIIFTSSRRGEPIHRVRSSTRIAEISKKSSLLLLAAREKK